MLVWWKVNSAKKANLFEKTCCFEHESKRGDVGGCCLGGFGCQHGIGWKSRGDKKTASVKAAMLRRRVKIIGQLVWLFRPLLVGTALGRMQSTSDWTQFCHRGHISWYQLMTYATHKIFPTGSESLPFVVRKQPDPLCRHCRRLFFLDSAKDCVLFGRSTTFYVFLQHASSEAWSARDRWMNKTKV